MADTPMDASVSQQAGSPSPPLDMTAPETIKRLYETTYAEQRKGREQWYASYAAMLRDVRNASARDLATPDFQRRLWENNPVSSSGASTISMTQVVESRELGEWLGHAAKTSLPPAVPNA